ncbi:MAG: nicotinate-nucleotide adenylyltransferase [Thermodesulfobacteriota bacterium]
MEKVGIFGGTFDPVHYGHLRIALEVREGLGLDRVVFVVSNVAPHKEVGAFAPAKDRQAMVRAAVSGVEGFELSDVEIGRPGPSYTVDTLRDLAAGGGRELYFIVGTDAFLEIHTWRAFPEFLKLARFVVVSRPGSESPGRVAGYLAERLPGCYLATRETGFAPAKEGFLPIARYRATQLDISSTLVRKLTGEGKSLRFLSPPEVIAIIEEKGLYGYRRKN